MKTNGVVYNVVFWAGYWDVRRAVRTAVDRELHRAVDETLSTAVNEAVRTAVYEAARGNPSHPTLRDFLAAASKVAA